MFSLRLPKLNISKFKLPKPKISLPKLSKNQIFLILILVFFIFGFFSGIVLNIYFYPEIRDYLKRFKIELPQPVVEEKVIEKEKIVEKYLPQTSQEEAIIKVVNEVSPAVVSIIITKDIPILEEYYISPFEEFFKEIPFEFKIPQYREKGVEKKEIGGGTGFIISEDGMILTNRHVVLDEKADYTVLTNDGRKFPAKVLARDPVQDLAILKIEREKIVDKEGKLLLEDFVVAKPGDSDTLQIGQTVIAIGNALGEFRNTVSVGVISGLGRTITASGGGLIITLEDVIQTDAAINRGNSGGPLLNLKGEVIGVNFAMAEAAENIGFAIPINKAKKDIEQVKKFGKITYAFLGIYYTLVTESLQEKYNLPVDYGAWVGRDKDGNLTETAIFSGSAAERAGIQRDDIILEFGGQKITPENSLAKIIQKYNPGDKVILKILRGKEIKIIEVFLGERSE